MSPDDDSPTRFRPAPYAASAGDRPAVITASGHVVTFAQLEERSSRLAQALFASGLRSGDHVAVLLPNDDRTHEVAFALQRSGLYYTCINSYLTPDELAYIVDNSQSQVLITSSAKLPVAQAALAKCPRVKRCLVVDGGAAVRALRDSRYVDFAEATERREALRGKHNPRGPRCQRKPTP